MWIFKNRVTIKSKNIVYYLLIYLELEEYAREVWTDQGKMLQCLICNKIVKHKQSLKDHIEGQHQHNEFFCTQCGKVLNTKGALRMHMKRNHPQISVNLKITWCCIFNHYKQI